MFVSTVRIEKAGVVPANQDDSSDKLDVSENITEVLNDLGVSVTLQNRDLIYVDTRNRPFGLGPERFSGNGDDQLFESEAASELRRLKETVFALREPKQAEIRIGSEGAETAWHRICARPNSTDGQVVGVVSASIDVTAKHNADEHLRLALLELSHRAKNLLAIVLSIARQTSMESISLAQFETRFEGRVRALALAHDILTEEKWRGASIFGLARSQIATFDSRRAAQFDTEGYNAYLRPNAAQHVGLALHELASWSALSGALSVPQGQIKLSSQLVPRDDGPRGLALHWTETGIPPQKDREESAFGQAVLTKIVPSSMEATANLEMLENGTRLHYALCLPPQQFF